MSHIQDYLIIEQKIATLERLDDIILKLKSEGMSLQQAIALESIQPSVLFDTYPAPAFTKEPSEWLLAVSLEKADYLKLGVIGALLSALVAFIIKLFRGRKPNSTDAKKDMDNAKEDATKAEETFDKARKEAAEEDRPGPAKVSPERIRQIHDYLLSINVSQEEARRICKDAVSLRDYFFFKDRYREDVFTFAMQGCGYEIILSEEYLAIQDDLKAVIQFIVPEAKKRAEYIEQLAAYSDWLITHFNSTDESKFPPLPLYEDDIGILRRYMSDEVSGHSSGTEVVNAFNGRVSALFTPRATPSTGLLTATEFTARFSATFDELVKAASLYDDYYITTGVRKIDMLGKHVNSINRYKALPNKTITAEKIQTLHKVVTEELRCTARIASTIILIRERSLKLIGIVENATKTLYSATAMVETLRKELKVGSMFTFEDAGMFAATPLSGSLGTGIHSAPAEEPIVPEDDFIQIEDMVEEAHVLESIRLEMEATGTVNRALVKTLPTQALALATRTYGLEQYTYEPSAVRFNVVMESIVSRTKEIVKSIIAYIRKKIEELVAWFKKKSQATKKEDSAKFADYIRDFSRGLELTRSAMANLAQITTSEPTASDIINIVMDTAISTVKSRDYLPVGRRPIGPLNNNTSNPESSRFIGAALFDYGLTEISMGKLHTFLYDIMENTTGKERPFLSAAGDEQLRLYTMILSNCAKIELASTGKGEMIYSSDSAADDLFIANIAETFGLSLSPELKGDRLQSGAGVAALVQLRLKASKKLGERSPDRYLTLDMVKGWEAGDIPKNLEKLVQGNNIIAIDARYDKLSESLSRNRETDLEVIEGLKRVANDISAYIQIVILCTSLEEAVSHRWEFAAVGSAIGSALVEACRRIGHSSQVSPDMKKAVAKLKDEYISAVSKGEMEFFFDIVTVSDVR